MTDKITIDEAGSQIVEYTRLHRIEVGCLDFEPMSEEERVKAGQLLDYLLRPIEQQFLLGKLSKRGSCTSDCFLFVTPFHLGV
jgi:hypothetical protein